MNNFQVGYTHENLVSFTIKASQKLERVNRHVIFWCPPLSILTIHSVRKYFIGLYSIFFLFICLSFIFYKNLRLFFVFLFLSVPLSLYIIEVESPNFKLEYLQEFRTQCASLKRIKRNQFRNYFHTFYQFFSSLRKVCLSLQYSISQ